MHRPDTDINPPDYFPSLSVNFLLVVEKSVLLFPNAPRLIFLVKSFLYGWRCGRMLVGKLPVSLNVLSVSAQAVLADCYHFPCCIHYIHLFPTPFHFVVIVAKVHTPLLACSHNYNFPGNTKLHLRR